MLKGPATLADDKKKGQSHAIFICYLGPGFYFLHLNWTQTGFGSYENKWTWISLKFDPLTFLHKIRMKFAFSSSHHIDIWILLSRNHHRKDNSLFSPSMIGGSLPIQKKKKKIGSNTIMKQQIYNGIECSFFLSLFSWDNLVWFKQLGSTCISWEDSNTSRTSLGALISWLPTSLILDWWQTTKCKRPISISHIRWALPRIWPGPYMGQPDYPHLLEEQFFTTDLYIIRKRKKKTNVCWSSEKDDDHFLY